MKRLGAVLLFLLMAAGIFAGIFCYAEWQQKKKAEETAVVQHEVLTVYTDLPSGMLQIFQEPYLKEYGVQLQIQGMSRAQLVAQAKAGNRPDVYVASQEALLALKREDALAVYVSDRTDTVLNDYKDEAGCWTGIWMDPAVFAVNAEFADTNPAFFYTWDEVLARKSVRLIVTDFIAADYAEDSLLSLVEHFGEEGAFARLRQGAAHTVQYGKYLSTPAHMAAMDKCDIGISGYNEARRVKKEGLPVRILYPEDGTYFYLQGIALAKDSPHAEAAGQYIDWMLSSMDREDRLSESGYDLIYVNGMKMPLDDAKAKLVLWPLDKQYTEEGKKALLDRWVHEIRFGNAQ